MLSLHINLHSFIAIIISWSYVSCLCVYVCETLQAKTNYMAKPAALVMICQHIYNVRRQVSQRDERKDSRWSDNVYVLLFLVSVAHSHATQWLLSFLPSSAFVFLLLLPPYGNSLNWCKKWKSKTQKLAQAQSSEKIQHRRICKKVRFILCVCYDLQL